MDELLIASSFHELIIDAGSSTRQFGQLSSRQGTKKQNLLFGGKVKSRSQPFSHPTLPNKTLRRFIKVFSHRRNDFSPFPKNKKINKCSFSHKMIKKSYCFFVSLSLDQLFEEK